MMVMLLKSGSPYIVYVLRLWCDGSDAPWRAVLDCARTGEHYCFADMAALFTFLEVATSEARPQSLTIPIEDTGHEKKVK